MTFTPYTQGLAQGQSFGPGVTTYGVPPSITPGVGSAQAATIAAANALTPSTLSGYTAGPVSGSSAPNANAMLANRMADSLAASQADAASHPDLTLRSVNMPETFSSYVYHPAALSAVPASELDASRTAYAQQQANLAAHPWTEANRTTTLFNPDARIATGGSARTNQQIWGDWLASNPSTPSDVNAFANYSRLLGHDPTYNGPAYRSQAYNDINYTNFATEIPTEWINPGNDHLYRPEQLAPTMASTYRDMWNNYLASNPANTTDQTLFINWERNAYGDPTYHVATANM